MATDLAVLYPAPQKSITVVQSRRLMPRFHPLLHETVQKRFDDLGIKTVLGSRAVVPEGGFEGVKQVTTVDRRIVEADYVVSGL
jgi:pyruvate/2-oxoglutarate dehydrogenase complex dihydrolipoamide dehydrogenase (E3) component